MLTNEFPIKIKLCLGQSDYQVSIFVFLGAKNHLNSIVQKKSTYPLLKSNSFVERTGSLATFWSSKDTPAVFFLFPLPWKTICVGENKVTKCDIF